MPFQLNEFLFIKGQRCSGLRAPPLWAVQLENVRWWHDARVGLCHTNDIADFLPVQDSPSLRFSVRHDTLEQIGKCLNTRGTRKFAWLKHEVLHLDERGNLHHASQPAFVSGDIDLWFSHGIHFTYEYIKFLKTDQDEIDPQEVLKIENVDIRREVIRKIGVERVLDGLFHRTIERHEYMGRQYELIEVIIGNSIWNNARYLKMLNPSIGVWHLEGVDNSCATVEEALLWRNNNKFAHAHILT